MANLKSLLRAFGLKIKTRTNCKNRSWGGLSVFFPSYFSTCNTLIMLDARGVNVVPPFPYQFSLAAYIV